jgi:RNA polymerase sigma-70 factor (ECF subfamily)
LAPEARSDEQLIEAFVAGERPAFEEIVRRHEDRLFGLALRMTGNRTDALDATQDAFVAAFRRAHSFRGDSAFGTWLYRVAINVTQDLLRKRSRDVVSETEVEEHAATGSVERVEDAAVARLDVARALAALPEEYREAVVMHDLGGVPYDEIARLTQTPMGTVKSRISRGRRQLAGLLEHREAPEPSNRKTPDTTPGGALS